MKRRILYQFNGVKCVHGFSIKVCLLLIFSVYTASADSGRLDLGIGSGFASVPDYIGSDESSLFGLPFPYFKYESDRIKIDRRAARGTLFRLGRLSLEIDASGRIPVDSEENEARSGMPDLDLVLELGPAIKLDLWGEKKSETHVFLEWPIRAAASTDFNSVDSQGWLTEPKLLLVNRWLRGRSGGWQLSTSAGIGVRWLSQENVNYFYSVDESFSTNERPSFSFQEDIYAGWQLRGGLSMKNQQWLLGAFTRMTFLSGSDLEESPLVREDQSVEVGIAVSRLLYEFRF